MAGGRHTDGEETARTVTITTQAVVHGDTVIPLDGLSRVRRTREPNSDLPARVAAGLTAALAILALAALVNGSVAEGLGLALVALVVGLARQRLRREPLWSLVLETRSGAAQTISSPHRGAIERTSTLLRQAIEGGMPAESAIVHLDLGTVETRSVGTDGQVGQMPSDQDSPPKTRWHRPTERIPKDLEDEVASFTQAVRASFAEDDWESERVLILLESEIVSPRPRHRLAENLWKEIRAVAPRTGRLDEDFRRLLAWPRGNAAA